jgi:N-carbamoyl-L-amino-acid hydrolase
LNIDLEKSSAQVLKDLKTLSEMTSDDDGAQRLAWSDTWANARNWFTDELNRYEIPYDIDSAGNIWAKIEGETDEAIALGSHLDSVPNGGWLDGILGVMSGLEAMRIYSQANEKPKKTIYLVDWADEEGARFGYSTFGSSAASGSLDIEPLLGRKGADGKTFEDALSERGVDAKKVLDAQGEMKARNLTTYLEMHIEQGPVLEDANQAVSAVTGISGVKRNNITFTGQAVHAGSFPTEMRQDAFLAAAESALAIRELALKYDAVSTVGEVEVEPNVVTIVPGKTTISLDQRTTDPEALENLFKETKEVVQKAADTHNVDVEWDEIMDKTPGVFDDDLIALAKEAVEEETGTSYEMPSGPNHDAMEMSSLMPTVMLFVMSENGISHAKEEHTPEDKVEESVRAFLRLVDKIINK